MLKSHVIINLRGGIQANLTAKLYDTYDRATVWTSSAKGRDTVANISIHTEGGFYFDAEDPARAYGGLVDGLVEDVTYDLRVRYERQ